MNAPQTAPATAPVNNKPTFASIKAAVKQDAEDVGKGKDGYVKMLIRLSEGAYHGAVDMDPDKHGAGRDDAMELIADYAKFKGISQQFKGKSDNERKLLSNGRKGIKLGQWSKGGNIIANISDLMFRRNKRFGQDAKTTEDAANSFLRYATAQIRADVLIEGTDLDQFCVKGGAKHKSDKAVLKGIIKQLDKVGDKSTEISDARHAIIKRVNAITIAEVAAKTVLAGVTVADVDDSEEIAA